MVKRAVGTKACLLGKAVTCKYLRQDNFLEVIFSHTFTASDAVDTLLEIIQDV
jgi:hypothetical protein